MRTAGSCGPGASGWSPTTSAPRGIARYVLKDLDFATDVATATRTDAALLPAVRAAFADLVARGMGDSDMAVTKRYIEERSRRR